MHSEQCTVHCAKSTAECRLIYISAGGWTSWRPRGDSTPDTANTREYRVQSTDTASTREYRGQGTGSISTQLEVVKVTKLDSRRSEEYKIQGKFDIEQLYTRLDYNVSSVQCWPYCPGDHITASITALPPPAGH